MPELVLDFRESPMRAESLGLPEALPCIPPLGRSDFSRCPKLSCDIVHNVAYNK
jgi:hypothetical protein